MSNFGDPTWEYHATQAKVAALTAQRLVGTRFRAHICNEMKTHFLCLPVDDVFLPYNYTEYAISLAAGVDALQAELQAINSTNRPSNVTLMLTALTESVRFALNKDHR